MKNNKVLSRRDLLKYGSLGLVGAGAFGILGCAGNNLVATDTSTDSAGEAGSTACGVIPSETAGPYPAHDDSAKNCLRFTGIQRSDIRSSLNTGGYSGTATATGVPLTITLNLVSAASGCATTLGGYAIYIWHCNVAGDYSMYSGTAANETYLRGVQQTDSQGSCTFTTIFPGCYDGRMTHVHFEVYPNLAQAVDDSYVTKTSQLTFPLSIMNAVYNNVSAYSASNTNFAKISYATDNVFSDGITYQVASVTGSYSAGYAATLMVAI